MKVIRDGQVIGEVQRQNGYIDNVERAGKSRFMQKGKWLARCTSFVSAFSMGVNFPTKDAAVKFVVEEHEALQ